MEYADFVTSTTHKSLRGPRGGIILTNNEDLFKKIQSQVFPGVQGGPLMHVIAAKAVCFGECLKPDFKDYTAQVVKNAQALAAALSALGYRIVSGGTDNHLMLVDLRPKGLNGKIASETLDKAAITVNKNGIPFDTEKITLGGGIRIGTPAVTTRGMKEAEMTQIAAWIDRALTNRENDAVLAEIRKDVERTHCERSFFNEASRRGALERVNTLFPRLKERRTQLAGTLSGGERQMLAVGRALMSGPKLLMLDEPSLGLAPLIVQEILAIVRSLRDDGVSILLVEQNARAALENSDRGYVLETGEIALEGNSQELAGDPRVQATSLGGGRDDD
jgi:ABC-type lipopolysaccharide export system ATPase subunit